MAFNAECFEKATRLTQGVHRQNGIAKTRLDQPFDGLGIICFHGDFKRQVEFFEKLIDHAADIAVFGIKQKRSGGEFGNLHRPDAAAPNLFARRTNDQKLLVKEWDDFKILFSHGQRNQAQIESAIQQSGQLGHVLYYEDLFSEASLCATLKFLNVAEPNPALLAGQTWKLSSTSLRDLVASFDSLESSLRGTPLEEELYSAGY